MLVTKVRLNQNGSAIIPLLAIAALMGGVIAGIVILNESLSTSVARTSLRSEMDGVVQQIQNMLMQPGACRQALRGPGAAASAPKINYGNPNTSPTAPGSVVEQIIWDLDPASGSPPKPVVWRGRVFSPTSGANGRFRLQDIIVRPLRPWEVAAPLPPAPTPGTMRGPAGVTWYTAPAKLEFVFNDITHAQKGSNTQRQGFTIMIARSSPSANAPGPIEDCYSPSDSKLTNFDCNNDTLTPLRLTGPVALRDPPPTCVGTPTSGCKDHYYIAGFDGLGGPICRCDRFCH